MSPLSNAFNNFKEDKAHARALHAAWCILYSDYSYEAFLCKVEACVEQIRLNETDNACVSCIRVGWKDNRLSVVLSTDKEWNGEVKHKLATGQKWRNGESTYIVSVNDTLVNIETGLTWAGSKGMNDEDASFERVS